MSPRPSLRPVVVLLLACSGVLAAACGGSSPTGASSTAGSPAAAPIFDPSVLHEVRIEMDPAAWADLRRLFHQNQYYAANLSIDGVGVQQVGVRSRGNSSRNENKPALRFEFDKYAPGQEYHGYKSLHLDNLWTDPSMLRERLSFLVFEAMGIAAPANAFGRLTVNGEPWGVYALVEPVSRPFLEARLGDRTGTLFDYEWAFTWDFSWLGADPGRYVPSPFEPETNEGRPGLADGLVDFIRAINDTSDGNFVRVMGEYLDTDRLLTHVAVENAICESDGLLGDEGINNFYLYEYGQRRGFVFVPWDKDTTFTCESWPLDRNLETNVLVRRLTADPERREYYRRMVERAVREFVNPRWLTPQLEQGWQQIRAAALADSRKQFSNEELLQGIEGLRGVIAAREADVRAQR